MACFQEVLCFKDKGILAVQVLPCAVDAIIGILGNVGEVAADASLVARWDIELFSALKTSRSPNHLSYHHQSRFSRFQDLVVILRRVTGVTITIRVI